MSSGSDEFEIGTTGRGEDFLSFSGAGEAEEFVRLHMSDPDDLRKLRMAMTEEGADPEMKNLDDHQLLQAAAQRIARGEIRIFPRAVSTPAFAVEEEKKKAAPALKGEKSWIAFKFVHDATGEPIANLQLKVTLPDGTEQEGKTDSEGTLEFKEIPEGACSLTSPIQGAKHRRTFFVVAEGDKQIDRTLPASQEEKDDDSGPWWIADVTTHEMKEGETLDAVATSNGTSAQDLTMFNWGTADRAPIEDFLSSGDRPPTPGESPASPPDSETPPRVADRMVRVAGPDPVRLLIPKSWKRDGLACFHTHTFRLESILTVQGHVSLVLYDDLWMAPLPGKPYLIEGPNGARFEGTTGGDGSLEAGPVPLDFFTLTISNVRLMRLGSVSGEPGPDLEDAEAGEPTPPTEVEETPLPLEPSLLSRDDLSASSEEPIDDSGEEKTPFPPEASPSPGEDTVILSIPSVRTNTSRVPQRLPGVAPELDRRWAWLDDDLSIPSNEALA